MLQSQVVGVSESQAREAAECKHISDTLQPFVGQFFADKHLKLGSGQVIFVLVVFLLHLVAFERIFLDPLVPHGVEGKVFHTAQQGDRSVVVAVVGCLDKGVKAVDIVVID